MNVLQSAKNIGGVIRICGQANQSSDCVELAVVDGAIRIQSFNLEPPCSVPSKYVTLEALEDAVRKLKELMTPPEADSEIAQILESGE